MIDHWSGLSLQIVSGLLVAILFLVLSRVIRLLKGPKKYIQENREKKTQELQYHSNYHLGFNLGAGFFVLLLIILPLIRVMGPFEPGIDSWLRLKALILMVSVCFFLLTALLYSLKKADLSWRRRL